MDAKVLIYPNKATDTALLQCLYDMAAAGRSFLVVARAPSAFPSPEQFREVWQSIQTGISIARERALDMRHQEVFESLELLSTELREGF